MKVARWSFEREKSKIRLGGSRKENARFSSFLYSSSFFFYFRLPGVKRFSLSLSLIAPPTHKSPPLFAKKPFSFSSPLPPPIENDDTLFPASRSRGLAINYPSLLSFPPPFFNFLERRNLLPSPLWWPLPAHEMDPSRNNGNRKVELVSNTRNFSVRSRTQERGKIKLMNDRSLHFWYNGDCRA